MSYHEKRSIVSIFAGIIILSIYCVYCFDKYRSGAISLENLSSWAGIILVFVAIGVASSIVIQIIFHILLSISMTVKEQVVSGKVDDKQIERALKSEMIEDEMDKLIDLKSMRVGYAVAGIGFMAALLSQVLGAPAAILLHILFLAFCLGSLIEGCVQIYFCRRGVSNG